MEIILLEDVINLGKIGDVVKVARGYARNFLIPFRKAKLANVENKADFELKRADYEAKQNQKLADAKSQFDLLNDKPFNIVAKASVDGKLFGSVTALDIVDAIKKSEIALTVSKSAILLPDGALKNIGEFDITINLNHDIKPIIKVSITAEG